MIEMPSGNRIILLSEGRLVEPWQRHRPPVLRDVGLFHQPGSGADRTVDQGQGIAPGVYILPKALDEKVARLHLKKIGVKLTELRPDQADYIGVKRRRPVQIGTLPLLISAGFQSKAPLRRGLLFMGNAEQYFPL